MDEQRFDDLARRLAGTTSRRSLLKGLAAMVVSGISGTRLAPPLPVSADSEPDSDRDHNNGQGCKRAGKTCKKHGQCCSGLNCGASGVCEPGCWIAGQAVPPGVHPSNPCLTCDPGRDASGWSPMSSDTQCRAAEMCSSEGMCDGAGSCISTPLPPRITCPDNQSVVTGGGICGAIVTFSADAECGTAVCDHASGETFPTGTTTVHCTAENGVGSDTCSFTVSVTDGSDPDISCPADIERSASSIDGATVHFTASATDNCTGVQFSCVPASGSQFPLGTTNVTCTAQDTVGRQDECSFQVHVACVPNCSGKSCGDSDGCGGVCFGQCPDPGPCANAVCNPATSSCDVEHLPAGTSCESPCNLGAICIEGGICTGGTEPACTSRPSDCHRATGTCDEATGECVYDLLPEGTTCGEPRSACEPRTCTADGSCEVTPVDCDSECQTCDNTTGTCRNINERGVCGDGREICLSGQCTSPCGESCVDYCYERINADGSRTHTYFCCPEEARMENGFCCWIDGQPGAISDDGFCVSPRKVCADGKMCGAECCGSSAEGWAGVCPTAQEFCAPDGSVLPLGVTCTSDQECTALGYAVCAGLQYAFDPETGPTPINTGTCCAAGYWGYNGFSSTVPVYSCCPPPSRRVDTGMDGFCCSYPVYASSGCIGCNCSFNRITRCCD